MKTKHWWIIGGLAVLAGGAFFCYHAISSPEIELLKLKQQLAQPREYFHCSRNGPFTIGFSSPTIQPAALRRAGLMPTKETKEKETSIWEIDLTNRRTDGTAADCGQILLRFEKDGLSQIVLPAAVGRLVTDEAFFQYLTILSHSKIDFQKRRSVYVPDPNVQIQPLAFPAEGEMTDLFGPPAEQLKGKAYTIDTYKLTLVGKKDRTPRIIRSDFAYHPWTGTFKYCQVVVAGFAIMFDEGGIFIKR